jgi:hypothetical protein
MTTTQHPPRPNSARSRGERRRATRSPRRLAVTLVAGVVAVGGVTAAVVLPDGDGGILSGLGLHGGDLPSGGRSVGDGAASADGGAGGSAAVSPMTPITLPDQVAGRDKLPKDADPLQDPVWRDKARAGVTAVAFVAQGYGHTDQNETLRVVAARTDLTGILDVAMAVDPGQQIGPNRCTQNTQLVPGGTAMVRPTVVVCWRTGADLSASAVLITPRRTVSPAEGSAALDEVWAAITKG